MTTQYTTILKLALPVQGELSGTWGDVVNDNITQMVEQAIAGKATVNSWTANSHTLTTADGTTSESRCAILELTDSGTALTGAGTVVCPTNTKLYIVDNNTAQIITVKTSGGTGVAVPVGKTMLVYCDGTNVVEGVTHANSLSLGTSTSTVNAIDTATDLGAGSSSNSNLPTQLAVKTYVDSQVGTVDTLSEILANGNVTGANDIDVENAQKVQFRDAAIYLNSSVDGQLDIVADGEVQIATALVDINGNLDVSGTANIGGPISFTKNAIAGVAISTIARASNTVTVTNSAVHGLTNGDLVNINGVANRSFNGYFTVAVSSTTVFTYSQTGADESSTGGTSTEVVYNINASGTGLNQMNGPLNIAANSGIDGLEITQSGSGEALSITGGNALFGDNDKAIFGIDNDLQIYHDGSNSFISDQGTGHLKLLAGDFRLNSAADDSQMISAVSGAEVNLYYNNALKLATTASGIDITGTATAASFETDAGGTFTTATGNDLNIVYPASRSLFIKEGSETHVTVDNVGNVGVGGAATAFGSGVAVLQLTGTSSGNATRAGALRFKSQDGTSSVCDIYSDNGFMSFYTGTSTSTAEAARIDSSQNFLAGNTIANPASGFNNQKGLAYTFSSGKVEIATTADAPALEIGKNNANDGDLVTFRKQSTQVGSIGSRSGVVSYIVLDPRSGVKGAALIGGSVDANNGIINPGKADGDIADDAISLGGSSSRFKNLHLSGTANVGGTSVSQSLIQMIANSTNGANTIHFGDATSGAASYVGYINYAHDSNSMQFSTNGTERMRIDSTGTVAVGTTDLPVWDTAVFDGRIRIGARGALATTTASTQLVHNTYYNGTYKYIGNDFATRYYSNDGNHVWLTAPSGTANNTITFSSPRMVILNDGNVGIGVSTSLQGKLNVGGDTGGDPSMYVFGSRGAADNLPAGHLTFRNVANGVGDVNLSRIQSLTGTGSNQTQKGQLAFSTNDGSSLVERLRIKSDGKVDVGTVPGQTFAVLNARRNGAAIEFGHGNNGSGYYGTAGSYGNNGQPYIGFSCWSQENLNLFTTNGFKGNIITGDLSGNLVFAQVTSASAVDQAPTERMRLDVSGNLLVRQSSAAVSDTHNGGTVEQFWGNQFSSSNSTNTKVMIGSGSNEGYVGASRLSSSGQYVVNSYLRFDNTNATAGSDAGRILFFTQTGGTNAAERMRINPEGTIEAQHEAYDGMQRSLTLSNPRNAAGTGDGTAIYFNNTGTSTIARSAYIGGVSETNYGQSNALVFGTSSGGNAPTESVRIDSSGNLLVATSTPTNQGVTIYGSGANGIYSATTSTSAYWITNLGITSATGNLFSFYNNATATGSITITSTNVTNYNSVSDERLKENIADADDAGSKIDAIQVRKFDWKSGGEHQDYGFIAQELLEVAPVAVSVPEDPEEMMAVDPAKLVPMMLKEIQSLRARIAALES